MILIQNILNFTLYDWLLVVGLVILLAVQLVSLWKKKASKIKIGLNLLLWTSVCLMFINPTWKKSSDTNKVLIFSENVSKTSVQKVKDSLKIGEIFSQKDFNRQLGESQDFVNKLGNLYFLGQDASPEILSKLTNHSIIWIPDFQKDELQNINWNTFVKKGQIQEITGKIDLSEPKILKIKFGNQTLDSLALKKGFSNFSLKFPTFALGRTELSLELGDENLQNIHFFTAHNPSKNILFILSNPDFESKTLADWLGKSGNNVEIQTTVAKNTLSNISINQTKNFSPDIVITDPSNAGNSRVKKAFSEGKSVLFINIENPDLAAKNINQSLGTKWKLKRISTQENRPISSDLTAQPYDFEPNIFQKNIVDFPIAIQKNIGKVGISLLNETFPLILSGDSLTYAKIWQSAFQTLDPSSENNTIIDAPVFQDVNKEIIVNSSKNQANLHVEDDSIRVLQSAINPNSVTANYTFRKAGWQPFQDSLEVFVETNQSSFAKATAIKPYLKTNQNNTNTAQILETSMPEWFWFILIIFILSLIWIEPKMN